MNLLHLLGEHRSRAALVLLLVGAVVVSLVGIDRWRTAENALPAPARTAASRPVPPPATASPSSAAAATPAPTPDPALAQATALAFCRQYFASSWQESAAQEQARVAPYLTGRALGGWRAQLTPAQVSARETASVTGCQVTDEGAASKVELGFFLDARIVTTSSAGSQTRTAAAEVFLVAVGRQWKVDQVRA